MLTVCLYQLTCVLCCLSTYFKEADWSAVLPVCLYKLTCVLCSMSAFLSCSVHCVACLPVSADLCTVLVLPVYLLNIS
jgi:hypothetical protein